jgi:hypothetical protein
MVANTIFYKSVFRTQAAGDLNWGWASNLRAIPKTLRRARKLYSGSKDFHADAITVAFQEI